MKYIIIILTLFAVAQCKAQHTGCIADSAFLGTKCDTVYVTSKCYLTYPGQYVDVYRVRDTTTNKWHFIEIPNKVRNEMARKAAESAIVTFKPDTLIIGKDTFRYPVKRPNYF